jgi:protein SCO1/2
MKKIASALVLYVIILSACNNNDSSTKSINSTMVVSTDSTAVKYQCPMKCEGDTAYTTAGQCPVCEMDLVKL